MEIHRVISADKLKELLAKIQGEVAEWKIIEMVLEGGQEVNILYVVRQMNDYFGIWDGAIFVLDDTRVVVLARLGSKTELTKIRQGLIDRLPDYKYQINANAMSEEGVKKIEIRLTEAAKTQRGLDASRYDMLKKRAGRKEKLFFVVDDDMFMRTLVIKVLRQHGRVVEFSDGANLVDLYLRDLPDVVFLDIHLPSGSGMDILGEITEFDITAGIVMLSSDSVKDNVLLSQARGAKAFLAKPFTKEKVEASLRKCLDQAAVLLKQAG